MNSRYMLDTNMASYVIKGTFPSIREKLVSVPMANVCISAVTQAELLFGLAKKPEASKLKVVVHEFLLRVDILPWDSEAAECYAHLRSQLERDGVPLGSMDMMIAAHSMATGTVLVTNDQAFHNVRKFLTLADWSVA